MAKCLNPEQCDVLHQQFPPPDCCICNFKEMLPAIVFAIYYDDLGDTDEDTWESSVRRWKHIWKPALAQEHSGDCTNECHSCFRCQAEDCVRIARIIEEGLAGG